MQSKNIDYKKQGRLNRQRGARFEKQVREYLTKQGWIVTKFQGNLEFEISDIGDDEDKMILEQKVNFVIARPSRYRLSTTGFPDFICYKKDKNRFIVMFVECKVNGILKKIEKEKLKWYVKNSYCNYFQMAYKEGRKMKFKLMETDGGKY